MLHRALGVGRDRARRGPVGHRATGRICWTSRSAASPASASTSSRRRPTARPPSRARRHRRSRPGARGRRAARRRDRGDSVRPNPAPSISSRERVDEPCELELAGRARARCRRTRGRARPSAPARSPPTALIAVGPRAVSGRTRRDRGGTRPRSRARPSTPAAWVIGLHSTPLDRRERARDRGRGTGRGAATPSSSRRSPG